MQPEGPPRESSRPTRESGGRGPGRRDLAGRVFPLGDWGEPADRLDALYLWTEEGALRAADWYLHDRLAKRRGASWGCLSLLLAAVCLGGDRYFGVTAGWMRDLATAQAIHRRLEALQFDWATESVREVLGPAEGTAGEAAERCLGVLRRFNEDLGELVRAETAGWMAEFRTDSLRFAADGGGSAAVSPRQEGAPAAGRFAVPHRARPNMPRQRPPE